MFTLGHSFMPPGIHAGGLRYHGMAPMVSHVYDLGLIEAVAVHQTKVFEAAQLFAKTEGIMPAPETAHAIRAAINEALKAKEEGGAGTSSSTSAATACWTWAPTTPYPQRQARRLRLPGGGDRRVDREAPEGRVATPARPHSR